MGWWCAGGKNALLFIYYYYYQKRKKKKSTNLKKKSKTTSKLTLFFFFFWSIAILMGDSKFSTWKYLIHGILIEDRNKGAFNNDRKALTKVAFVFLA